MSDLDNNGLDDVIVGAPLFSDFGTDNMYETGRVYIYYQNSKVGTDNVCCGSALSFQEVSDGFLQEV